MIYIPLTTGGKTTCKYYKACGNPENCKRCFSYTKDKKCNKVKQHSL